MTTSYSTAHAGVNNSATNALETNIVLKRERDAGTSIVQSGTGAGYAKVAYGHKGYPVL